MPRTPADWLGVIGGFSFALNNVMLRREAHRPADARALAMFGGGALIGGAAALLGATAGIAAPPWPSAHVWGLPLVLAGGLVPGSQPGAAVRRGAAARQHHRRW